MLPGEIKKLYWDDGLSATEIGNIFNVSKWQVFKKMIKYKIPRRKQWETLKIQYERKPLSYKFKTRLNRKEKELHQAALMLYWAEGYKKGIHSVDFANSDVNMATIFLSTLRKIYRINEKKLRILIYCYANQDVNNLISFWSQKLSIPRTQFSKPYVRNDFNVNNPHKMEYGLVHIRYFD